MLLSKEMQLKSNAMTPQTIYANVEKVTLNGNSPVSISPVVESIKRDNNYPIIVVPRMMGSRLFDKKGKHMMKKQ